MKGVLSFSLPEEREEFELAQHGQDLRIVLDHVKERLRTWLKHGHQFTTPDEALEAVRAEIVDLEDQYGVLG